MKRSEPTGWIEKFAAGVRRYVAPLGRLALGPDLHVTLVIARAAIRARRRRAVVAAGHSPFRTER
jgi:hypothetical protein